MGGLTVIAGGDPLAPADFEDALLAAQAIESNAGFLFSLKMSTGHSTNILDYVFRRLLNWHL